MRYFPPNTNRAEVILIGGGGAGGACTSTYAQNQNAGGGGGGGGFTKITVEKGKYDEEPLQFIIGAGGVGQQSTGPSGEASSLYYKGTLLASAGGGTGGQAYGSSARTSAAGGTGNVTGGTGSPGMTYSQYEASYNGTPYLGPIGKGGDAPSGGSGGLGAWNGVGVAGQWPGGGGGGGTSYPGASGGNGQVAVRFYYQP